MYVSRECLPTYKVYSVLEVKDIKKILFRYLQTLSTIAAERNSTIVFPLPIDLMGALMNKTSK